MHEFMETLAGPGCSVATSTLPLKDREQKEPNLDRIGSQLHNENPRLSSQALFLDITVASCVLMSLIISITGAPRALWKSFGTAIHTCPLKVSTGTKLAGV